MDLLDIWFCWLEILTVSEVLAISLKVLVRFNEDNSQYVRDKKGKLMQNLRCIFRSMVIDIRINTYNKEYRL